MSGRLRSLADAWGWALVGAVCVLLGLVLYARRHGWPELGELTPVDVDELDDEG